MPIPRTNPNLNPHRNQAQTYLMRAIDSALRPMLVTISAMRSIPYWIKLEQILVVDEIDRDTYSVRVRFVYLRRPQPEDTFSYNGDAVPRFVSVRVQNGRRERYPTAVLDWVVEEVEACIFRDFETFVSEGATPRNYTVNVPHPPEASVRNYSPNEPVGLQSPTTNYTAVQVGEQ